MKFYQCPSGAVTEDHAVRVKKAHYLDEFVEANINEHSVHDFAILELESELPNYGYFGVDSSSGNVDSKKQKLFLAGYPSNEQKMM